MPSLRRPALLAALLLAAACKSLDVPVIAIPDGSEVFVMDPTLLNYHFVDSSAVSRLELTWLPKEPYAGDNCIALKATAPTDTTGTFVFVHNGPNVGRMLRNTAGVTDTVQGIFLSGHEGTHGTYAVTSSGQLKLFWVDASAARSFFEPAASIRLAGDTVASDVLQKASGDSVSTEWHVRWLRGTC